MVTSDLSCPPEYHIFTRGDRHLIVDPLNVMWFVTDACGKALFETLAKGATVEQVCDAVACHFPALSESDMRIYLEQYVTMLLRIGMLYRGPYQQRLQLATVTWRPTCLYLHLTSRCNLKCAYCYNSDHREEMKHEAEKCTPRTEDVLGLLERASHNGITGVKLTGGEPLLNRDWLAIAKRARECRLNVNLLTNGTLIRESAASDIARTVNSVSISLDSHIAGENDQLRGVGTYSRVLRAIEYLKQAGLGHLHINAVITPFNRQSVTRFLHFAYEKLGANEVTLAPNVLGTCNAQSDSSIQYGVSPDDLVGINTEWLEYSSSREQWPREIRRGLKGRNHCGAGAGVLSIDTNGDIYPCQTLHQPEFLMGNAFTETGLADCLNRISTGPPRVPGLSALPACQGCAVRYLCAGGCRAEAYTRDGGVTAVDPDLCRVRFEDFLGKMWRSAALGAKPAAAPRQTAPPPPPYVPNQTPLQDGVA